MHPIFHYFKPETVAKLRAMDWSIDTPYGIAAVAEHDRQKRCDCPLGWALYLEGHVLDAVVVPAGIGSFPTGDTVAARLHDGSNGGLIIGLASDFLGDYRVRLGEYLEVPYAQPS